MTNTQVFRPKSNLVWAGLALALDFLFVYQSLIYPIANSTLAVEISVGICVAGVVFLLWIRPKLILGDKTLTVVNPLQTVKIGYDEITNIETKWTLLIEHNGKSTRAWVAPANGKSSWIADSAFRWKNTRVPTSESRLDAITPMSQSTKSDSGIAAQLIRTRMQENH